MYEHVSLTPLKPSRHECEKQIPKWETSASLHAVPLAPGMGLKALSGVPWGLGSRGGRRCRSAGLHMGCWRSGAGTCRDATAPFPVSAGALLLVLMGWELCWRFRTTSTGPGSAASLTQTTPEVFNAQPHPSPHFPGN